MTKGDAWNETKQEGMICDFALPQQWLNDSADRLARITNTDRGTAYCRIVSQTVWVYTENDRFGSPFGITDDGKVVVALLDIEA